MWNALTGKQAFQDRASAMATAGLDPADAAVSGILEATRAHTSGLARSVLPPVFPTPGASAVFASFGTGSGVTDALSGIASASDHATRIAALFLASADSMSRFAVPRFGKPTADYAASMTRGLQPILDLSDTVGQWQGDMVKSLTPFLQTMSTFTVPSSFLGQIPSVVTGLQRLADQQRHVFDGITKALGGYDLSGILKLKRSLLPPNLRELADEIGFGDVHDFLREEAIPLYLVPRAPTALRFVQAADRPARHQILNECYDSLIDDCEAVLGQVDHPDVETEAEFVLDGVAAMRSGHTRAAQAMFTLTLDTLVFRIYPERKVRTKITTREPGGDVPEPINGMGYRDVSVWLPVWNAHGKFHPKPEAPVPWQFSRHATVHKVSRKQYSRRNTVQSLMLVTSLIGYADRLELSLP